MTGAKRRTEQENRGLGGASADTQRLKKNCCYQLLSVFAVHSFSPHMSDCLSRPTRLSASHQSAPV